MIVSVNLIFSAAVVLGTAADKIEIQTLWFQIPPESLIFQFMFKLPVTEFNCFQRMLQVGTETFKSVSYDNSSDELCTDHRCLL